MLLAQLIGARVAGVLSSEIIFKLFQSTLRRVLSDLSDVDYKDYAIEAIAGDGEMPTSFARTLSRDLPGASKE